MALVFLFCLCLQHVTGIKPEPQQWQRQILQPAKSWGDSCHGTLKLQSEMSTCLFCLKIWLILESVVIQLPTILLVVDFTEICFFVFIFVFGHPGAPGPGIRSELQLELSLQLQQLWTLNLLTGQGANVHPCAPETLLMLLCHSGNSWNVFYA